MNKDNSLLKLEKKLENNNEKDIILNKFKLKPNMKIEKNNENLKKENLLKFLNEFKKSNDKITKNKKKYNIEINENKKNDIIEIDLALGILEHKNKKDIEIKDIIKEYKKDIDIDYSNINNDIKKNISLNEEEQNLLNFIMNKNENKKYNKKKKNK